MLYTLGYKLWSVLGFIVIKVCYNIMYCFEHIVHLMWGGGGVGKIIDNSENVNILKIQL